MQEINIYAIIIISPSSQIRKTIQIYFVKRQPWRKTQYLHKFQDNSSTNLTKFHIPGH